MRSIAYFKLLIVLVILLNLGCKKVNSSENEETNTFKPVTGSLFQKYRGNPIFDIGGAVPTWRSIHAANVSILTPTDTLDGKWRLFMRGSGNNSDGYHDTIGTLEQEASGFNPFGPWKEISGNPVLRNGTVESYDALHLLDAAAESGPDKAIYLYYMGRDETNRASINGAKSTDGGKTFIKFTENPLKYDVGPNDVIYAGNKYHLFYGDAKYNGKGFDEPLQIWLSQSAAATAMSASPTYALKVGAPGAFDSYSVNGAKIFKVTGDSRYFMLYQASSHHFDYPDRFHCAYSNDLVTWTKVKNTMPLLTRGSAGEYDQGAIWTGAVIEHNGKLYVYYEGWGSFKNDAGVRNTPYYGGGNSRVGVASCSTTAFLKWVNE